jgi:hypothetical protein
MCISLFIFILYGERVPRAEHDRLSEQFLFSEVQQHNKYTTACFEWPWQHLSPVKCLYTVPSMNASS